MDSEHNNSSKKQANTTCDEQNEDIIGELSVSGNTFLGTSVQTTTVNENNISANNVKSRYC